MVTGIGSVATAATVPQQLGNTNMGTLVNSTQMAAAEPVKRPSDNRRVSIFFIQIFFDFLRNIIF